MAKLVKLHRSRNYNIIGGVMGGIAEYVGWSPFWIRFWFVVISCASVAVPGIIIYLILWLIMPKANQSSYQ